jgi:hypothetical protein
MSVEAHGEVMRKKEPYPSVGSSSQVKSRIYAALHEGSIHQWAIGKPSL